MRGLIVALVLLAGSAELRAQQLSRDAARSYADYQQVGPQRAFVVSGDGNAYWWAGSSGADPSRAVEAALKACKDKGNAQCTCTR